MGELMKISLLLTFLFSAQIAAAQVLATVGNSKITREEFDRKFTEVRKQTTNPPTPEQFLEDLIRFEVGVQEAEKMKLQNDPFVKERYRQVLYNSLLEKQIGDKVEAIKITDPEMKEFYKRNPELHLASILIDIKQNAKPEERELVRKRANEIMAEIKKSKRPFNELTKLYSDDLTSKDNGGDIGYQTRITLAAQLYDAALTMKPGEIKGPIETRFGFYIFKLLDKKSYDNADKRLVRAALFDEKRSKAFNDYFKVAKKQYKITIDQNAVKTLK